MTSIIENANFSSLQSSKSEDDQRFDIPLDISDIINVCKSYNKLGWNIQQQIEAILEFGVEDSIKDGRVKLESLPHIKDFLFSICEVAYFGDAAEIANTSIFLIEEYELNNIGSFILNKRN